MRSPGTHPTSEQRASNSVTDARTSSARRTMLVLLLVVCLIVLIRLVVAS